MGGLLGLLSLGQANDTAGDAAASSLSDALLTVLTSSVFSHSMVVSSLVQSHGASNNAVRALHLNNVVSALVLSVGVPSRLHLLNVTSSARIDVVVGMAMRGSEGVEDVA